LLKIIRRVYLANRSTLDIVCMSDVRIGVHSDTEWKLQKVKHIPKLKENLISIRYLDEERHAISVYGDK
jgi:hypothetical protein